MVCWFWEFTAILLLDDLCYFFAIYHLDVACNDKTCSPADCEMRNNLSFFVVKTYLALLQRCHSNHAPHIKIRTEMFLPISLCIAMEIQLEGDWTQ